MPGMNFLCCFDKHTSSREKSFRAHLDKTIIDTDYSYQDLFRTNSWISGSSHYADYPLISFDDDEFSIILEGNIYNQEISNLQPEIKSLLREIFSNNRTAFEHLRNWLLETDGEFIIFGWDKTNQKICLFNDVLGRLPLYYYQTKAEVAVSRNIRFLAELTENRQYDMMSIAQYLLLGYSLHQRTFLKDIYRLLPASLIRIDPEKGRCDVETVHVFNFENKPHRGKSLRENALELTQLMRQGVKSRAVLSHQVFLSLSGGLDSRTVGATLQAEKIPFETGTFIDYEKARQLDLDYAQALARTLGWTQDIMPLTAPTGGDFLKLLRIKPGRNYLGISFIVQYLEYLKQKYGRDFTFFYGNGGDRIARDIRPNRSFDSIDELVSYIVLRQQFFTLDELSSLVHIPAAEIVAELRDTIQSYPENDFVQKFIHFEVHGDALTRHIEGDDRTRHYFWTGTPFYSTAFFRYIMGIPDEQKKDFKLYQIILDSLCPEMAAIPYANVTTTVGSFRYKLYNVIKKVRKWPNPVRFTLRRLHLFPATAPYTHIHSPYFLECFREQIQNCPALGDTFNRPILANIIERHPQYKNAALETLFTICSAIEDIEEGRSSIENYRDKDFSVPSGSWNWYRHKPLDDKS